MLDLYDLQEINWSDDDCLTKLDKSNNFRFLFDFRNKSETEIRVSQTLEGNALTKQTFTKKKNHFLLQFQKTDNITENERVFWLNLKLPTL